MIPPLAMLLVAAAAAPGTATAEPFSGLARAIDGDSLMVGDQEVRLFGIIPSEVRQTGEDYRAEKPKAEPPSRTIRPFVSSPRPRAAASGSSSGCNIKGNDSRKGEWIYHLPGMPYYAQTRAEAMFCSEAEARAAGYRRSRADRRR
jgi:hypothetical protein